MHPQILVLTEKTLPRQPGSHATTLNLDLKGGYFVINNLSAGLRFNYNSTHGQAQDIQVPALVFSAVTIIKGKFSGVLESLR